MPRFGVDRGFAEGKRLTSVVGYPIRMGNHKGCPYVRFLFGGTETAR